MPASSRETVLCHYRYDPLDRLVDCAPTTEAVTQRFYCKSRLATEIQGAVQRSVFQHDDQLLAQRRREDTKVETTLLATDQQRSVLNVLDANRVHQLAYSPYGHRTAENGLLSLLGFNGEPPDPVTEYYLLGNGYRAFNPVLMRFNSPDSLSPFGDGGLNAYGYCAGDPINWTDPTGHIPIKYFTVHIPIKSLTMHIPIKPLTMHIPIKPLTGHIPITPDMDDFLLGVAKQGMRKAKKQAINHRYNQSLSRKAELIDQNEKLMKNQPLYSVSNDLTDLETSLKSYNRAKEGYHFDKFPDPNKPYVFKHRGEILYDLTHFDITLSHYKNLSSRAKVNQYNKLNPTTPLKRQGHYYIHHIKLLRAKYIKKFTTIDLLKDIRR